MNNKKASKQSIALPFNLNLIDNRPQVDNTFKNAEKVNAPYLNDMVSPIYVSTKDYEAVYDKKGNEYRLVTDDANTYFMRNDSVISTVDNKKFKRREITEVSQQKYDYYDISNDYIAAGWNNADNTITMSFNGHEVTSSQLFISGTIITGRTKVIDDEVIVVVYYDVNDVGYTFYWRIDSDGNTVVSNNTAREWYRMQARTNYTSAVTSWFNNTYSWFDNKQYSPLINIAKVNGNIIFSLISRYGRAYDTLGTHFITVFDDNGTLKQIGADIWPSTSSSSQQVEYKQQFYVYVSQNTSRTTGSAAIVKVNDVYYTYESFTQTDTAVQVSVPPDVIPIATGETATAYDDPLTSGPVYTVQCYTVTRKIQMKCSDSNISWQGTFGYTEEGTSHTLSTTTDTTTTKYVQWVKTYYSWETIPTINYDSADIIWTAADSTSRTNGIPQTDWVKNYLVSYTYYQTSNVSWITAPNVILDNGRMYTMAFFGLNTTAWSYSCPTGGVFIESADNITISGSSYSWTVRESTPANADANIPRSNSVVFDQDFIQTTWKLNNSAATVPSSLAGSTTETSGAMYREWMNTNSTSLTYNPGTSRDTSFNYYGAAVDTISVNSKGSGEDQPVFTVGGFRVPISGSSNFFLLYNVMSSGAAYIQGISYAKDGEAMGTLLTPLQSLDEDFYVVANDDMVVYRDQDNKYWEISIDDKAELMTILDNRYIVVNTTSYWNCYDSELNMRLHYATDYNDRVVWGVANTLSSLNGTNTYQRLTASAINAGYKIMPRIGVTSSIYLASSRYRLLNISPVAYNSRVDDTASQGIDVYYSDINGTDAPYRYTINPYLNQSIYEKFNLSGSTYETTDTVMLNPCIFTEYVYNQGNRDMAKETYTYYILEYVMNKPVLVYSAYSETGGSRTSYNEDDTTDFFVLQGQFYGVINDKICSIIYDNGAISEVDPIIDIRGMKFIGNNPQIAFFWNSATRSIHSFTGDASLDKLCDASKLIGLLSGKYFYDTMTQTIFVPTRAGLLCIASRNWFIIEDWKDVEQMSFSEDGVTHLINDAKTINFVYYPSEGYDVLPLNIETSFYGLGDKEATSIDKWQISLYDVSKEHKTSYITVGVRSLTDITVVSEEKTLKITPDMYDEWSHCVLINYTPKLIKGQGIRLYIKTPLVVQSITPHIADQTYAVQTNARKSM